jgi:alkylhydroperoxidase family enzyme
MARISPAPPERLAQVADVMERWRRTKGYPPNSWLTMLRRPGVFRAYRALHTAVMMDEGEIPVALRFMIAHVVSRECGDPYCAAHNAENAARIGGAPVEKIEALADFESNPLFDAAERAALDLARAAGAGRVTDRHFERLRGHFSEDAIVEIVAVLSLLGWLNRWNMTLATRLEPEADAFARRHLAPSGWQPGVHGADDQPEPERGS